MERFVPFPERVRWQMLKHSIESGLTAGQMAKRLGWPLHKVIKVVMAPKVQVRLKDVAIWHFAIDGSRCEFKLEPA